MRPDDIGKVFGQDHLLDVVVSWIQNPSEVPPSILLSGPYGVGKTTIARILAKHLASDSDITEINAANARGIDDARAWAEAARFSPLGTGCKIFIIDELHQMTHAAQSALLKVIEEPPPKIHYFLCTTEPSKLLPQIRSRCTPLELKLLQVDDTIDMLGFVFQHKLSHEIMTAIHRKSGGHARDAIKIAQVAVQTGAVTLEDLDRNVGFGYREIEGLLCSISERSDTFQNQIQNIHRVADEQALTEIVYRTVDNLVANADMRIVSCYKDFLELRALRADWKISAYQLATFITIKLYQLE